jgi:hypothetical protein
VRRGTSAEKRDFMGHCFSAALQRTEAWIARLSGRAGLRMEDPAYRAMWAKLNAEAGLTGLPA